MLHSRQTGSPAGIQADQQADGLRTEIRGGSESEFKGGVVPALQPGRQPSSEAVMAGRQAASQSSKQAGEEWASDRI